MKTTSTLFIILFLLCASPCFAQSADEAQPIKVFKLTDGTTLKGTLISVEEDGSYLVDTTKLGEVVIAPEEIVSITAESASPVQAASNPYQQPTATIPSAENLSGQMQEAKTVLTSDPAIMESMQQLMADPEIMQLMQDPSIMQTLMTMDPEKVQANPKIQKLMNHPIMQEIIQKAQRKMEKR